MLARSAFESEKIVIYEVIEWKWIANSLSSMSAYVYISCVINE